MRVDFWMLSHIRIAIRLIFITQPLLATQINKTVKIVMESKGVYMSEPPQEHGGTFKLPREKGRSTSMIAQKTITSINHVKHLRMN
jgi:hypothetical protein